MLTDHPTSHAAAAAGAGPRVLCVLDKHPLPADTGARRRLWNIVQGIATTATGTIVVLGGDTEPDRVDALAAALPTFRVVALPRDRARRPLGRTLRDVGAARLPVHLARRDLSGWRAALAAELRQGYDVVYVSHPRPFVLVEELTDLPILASIDDLAHVRHDRLEHERRATDAVRDAAVDAADDRAWPKLYTRICGRAAVVLVATPADRAELPGGRVMVLPNGADIPTRPLPRVPYADPTVLLHGQMLRASDADAAAFVVEHVLDEVRRRVPKARVRIVGRTTPGIQALGATHPAVDMIGYVDHMTPELLRADVAVVPLWVAGGARHRILEALAHGLPVVTTSIGLEGLDLTPGRHALVADDAASLAAALTSVLRDPTLAAALRHEGLRLVRERYDWVAIRHVVGEVVAGVAAGAARGR